jgi:hypothetical protein
MTLTLMTQSLKWKVMQNEMKLPYADESEVHENWNESLDMSNWLRIWTQDEKMQSVLKFFVKQYSVMGWKILLQNRNCVQ